MKGKGGKFSFVGLFLSFIFLIALAHTSIHIAVYGTGIPSLNEKGVSGLAIGKFDVDKELKNNNQMPLSSIIVIGVEWALVLMVMSGIVIRNKIADKKELNEIISAKITNKSKNKTDLDVLYDIITEKKKIKVSTAAKIFKVDSDTIIKWAEILESGDLATLNYPRMSEPEITINKK